MSFITSRPHNENTGDFDGDIMLKNGVFPYTIQDPVVWVNNIEDVIAEDHLINLRKDYDGLEEYEKRIIQNVNLGKIVNELSTDK